MAEIQTLAEAEREWPQSRLRKQPELNKMLLHVGIDSINTYSDVGRRSGGHYGARNQFSLGCFFSFKLLKSTISSKVATNNMQLTSYPETQKQHEGVKWKFCYPSCWGKGWEEKRWEGVL